MHACLCVHIVCACGGRRLVSGIILAGSPAWFTGAGCLGQTHTVPILPVNRLCPLPRLELQAGYQGLPAPIGLWGSQLETSCLHRKFFNHWAIFLTQEILLVCWSTVLRDPARGWWGTKPFCSQPWPGCLFLLRSPCSSQNGCRAHPGPAFNCSLSLLVFPFHTFVSAGILLWISTSDICSRLQAVRASCLPGWAVVCGTGCPLGAWPPLDFLHCAAENLFTLLEAWVLLFLCCLALSLEHWLPPPTLMLLKERLPWQLRAQKVLYGWRGLAVAVIHPFCSVKVMGRGQHS